MIDNIKIKLKQLRGKLLNPNNRDEMVLSFFGIMVILALAHLISFFSFMLLGAGCLVLWFFVIKPFFIKKQSAESVKKKWLTTFFATGIYSCFLSIAIAPSTIWNAFLAALFFSILHEFASLSITYNSSHELPLPIEIEKRRQTVYLLTGSSLLLIMLLLATHAAALNATIILTSLVIAFRLCFLFIYQETIQEIKTQRQNNLTKENFETIKQKLNPVSQLVFSSFRIFQSPPSQTEKNNQRTNAMALSSPLSTQQSNQTKVYNTNGTNRL